MNNWDINERNLSRVYDYCIRRGIQLDASFHNDSISYINLCLMQIKHQRVLSEEQFVYFVNRIKKIESFTISDQTKTELGLLSTSLEDKSQEALCYDLKSNVRRLKALLMHSKNDLLSDIFTKHCLEIEKKLHKWNLTSFVHLGSGKTVYSIGDGLDYLVCRILQENIKAKYDIRIGNRICIIKQLKCLLEDALPKAIVRTDIRSFFETINTIELIKEMDKDGRIQKSQIDLLSSLIDSYNEVSGNAIGVPRGVGISSYLAELYMQEIDEEIKKQPSVVYYARFVDDIVVITSEKEGRIDNASLLFAFLKKKLREKGLRTHSSGSKFKICSNNSINFSYLGYSFTQINNKLVVDISKEKVKKLKEKIKLAFVSFYNKEYDSICSSYRKKLLDLKERLECISRAVHVRGMHKRVEIGTPITYSEITRIDSLEILDRYLKSLIRQSNNNDLSNMLAKIKFTDGFMTPEVKDISSQKYKNLSKIWVHL